MVHHSEALAAESGDATLAEAVASGRFAAAGPRLEAMCTYAVALTRSPGSATRSLLDGVHAAGLGPREVIDLNQVAAYFNYVNRVVAGLGVTLERRWPAGVRTERRYDLPWP